MPTAFDMVRDAIINKKIIEATYGGYSRKMCPHALGTLKGRKVALFFQFEGGSRSGQHRSNWRTLPIDGLTDVQVIGGKCHTASRRGVRPMNWRSFDAVVDQQGSFDCFDERPCFFGAHSLASRPVNMAAMTSSETAPTLVPAHPPTARPFPTRRTPARLNLPTELL